MTINTTALVNREVYYCVSTLIAELSTKPEYMDELFQVQFRYDNDDENYPVEALEHWIVSDWLAGKLEEKGEMVLRDFLGLTIWGRTTSGQLIAADYVIEEITRELNSRA